MAIDALELSVVVPVYGELERLARCLAAVRLALEQSPQLSAEVVVSDDHSPDGLADRIAELHPEVRLLRSEVNRGFGGNANRGVEAARGRIVCLLNSDMYVDQGFFVGCADAFLDEALFAVCGRIVEPGGTNAGLKRLVLDPGGVRVKFALDSDPESDRTAHVPYANGGGAFFRRAQFLQLGGFAPEFAPFYWEDTDLGYRAWKQGLRILYDPTRRVLHDHQATIKKERPQRVKRIRARNQRLFIWRNLTDHSLLALLVCGTLWAALAALLRLRLRRLLWIMSDLRHVPAACRARAAARPSIKHSDAELRLLLDSQP